MTKNTPYPWPGPDERLVVSEMLADSNSLHWGECYKFLAKCLHKFDLSEEDQEDIDDEAFISVVINLGSFRFDAKLTTWLRRIAINKKNDWFRKQKYARSRELTDDSSSQTTMKVKKSESISVMPFSSLDPEVIESVSAPRTTEEECVRNEDCREIRAGFEEYARLHKNPKRIWEILEQAMFADSSQKEIAEQHGISSARVNQIIQGACRHVRTKRREAGDEPPAPLKHPD